MPNVQEIYLAGSEVTLEGPHWDVDRQSLFFVSSFGCSIFRYDYQTGKVHEARIDNESNEMLGFIVPVQGCSDEFILAIGRQLRLIKWDGHASTAKSFRVYAEVDQEITQPTSMDDGKCDAQGRIWTGTVFYDPNADMDDEVFGKRISSLYKIEAKGKVTKVLSDICISNGMTWNDKINKFYYVDSADLNLKEYDYDPSTGKISNERVVIEIPKGSFFLDGVTTDENGMLYIAAMPGGRVIKVDPVEKKIVDEYLIPGSEQVTSVAFGGPNLDELFVTTGALKMFAKPRGALFKISGLGVKGTEMNSAKI